MISLIFGVGLSALLIILALLEIARYRRAGRNPEEFPYPRHRLRRRIAISILFSAIVLLSAFWPKTKLWVQMVMLLGVTGGLLVGFFLIWRDLKETSQTAVRQALRLSQQTGNSLRTTLGEGTNGSPNGHKHGGPSGHRAGS